MTYPKDSDFNVKVGVGETSIKAYVLNPKIKRNMTGRMSTASFQVDYQVTPTLGYNNEIKIDLGFTIAGVTNKFYGLISNIKELEDKKLEITCKDFSKYFFEREFTEIYLDKTDVFIIKALIDKYCTELNYDSSSIPDSDTVTIDEFQYEDKYLITGFEELCERADKDLWTEGKKVYYKKRASVDSGYTIQRGVNAKSIVIIQDEHLMCNKVIVVGARRLFHTLEHFNGPGTEFTLKYKPHDTEVKVSDVLKKGGIQYMSTDVDYYVDYDQKKIIMVASSSDVDVDYNYTVPTKVEAKLMASIGPPGNYGIHFKKIENKNLTTRNEAKNFALDYINTHGYPLKMARILTIGTDGFKIAEQVTLVDPDKNINEKMTALEIEYSYSKDRGYVMNVKFAEESPNATDSMKILAEKIRKLEEQVLGQGDLITKVLTSRHSMIITIKGWTVKTRTLGQTFVLGPVPNGLLDGNNLLGETTLGEYEVQQTGD